MSKVALWKKGIKDGIPIFLGYLAVSFTFGIAAKKAGVSPLEAVLMSATNLTSAGQFAALNIIANSSTYFEMAVTQLIINLRYCLMSSALSQKLSSKMLYWHRFLISFGVTDEIFGVSISVKDKLSPCYGLMTAAIPGWTLGTFLGIMSGSLLPGNVVSALSVALYGMFIAVIIPPARKSKIIAGIVTISMILSLAFAKLPLLKNITSGFRIIILTVIIAGIAAFLFPIKEEQGEESL
ncbi:MAG: AzlC family ABC transporter permease [Acutalibacteraceae bacterium]|nr:AzlC family ABC transporter permease [Acutalibacteraceae bacterium]